MSWRILIVEDDPLLAEQLNQTLSRNRYELSGVATDLETAVKMMGKARPDLAIVDIKLNGPADGFATARELLKIKWIPLIYITGNSIEEFLEKSKSTYPAAFLEKPLRSKDLLIQMELALHSFYEGRSAGNESVTSGDIFVHADKSYVRIKPDAVLYLQADRIYSNLFLSRAEFARLYPGTAYRSVHVSLNLGQLFRQLPGSFYRVSRSLVVNLDRIDRISSSSVFVEDHEIVLPEGGRQTLMMRLGVGGKPRPA